MRKLDHTLHDLAQKQERTVQVGMALHLREMVPHHSWNPMDQLGGKSARQI
jgi:hypothetical protein